MYSPGLVRHMVLHFADLAGWEGERYLVTTSRRTFDKAARKNGQEPVADEWGSTLVRLMDDPEPFPVTWISPRLTRFADLAYVCAHEALHAARPKLPHGIAFERGVRKLLRGEEP